MPFFEYTPNFFSSTLCIFESHDFKEQTVDLNLAIKAATKQDTKIVLSNVDEKKFKDGFNTQYLGSQRKKERANM